jgi:hypothetical protein
LCLRGSNWLGSNTWEFGPTLLLLCSVNCDERQINVHLLQFLVFIHLRSVHVSEVLVVLNI